MNIFESLENLNVSEECFEDIINIIEAIIDESKESIAKTIMSKYSSLAAKENSENPTETDSYKKGRELFMKWNPPFVEGTGVHLTGFKGMAKDKGEELKKLEDSGKAKHTDKLLAHIDKTRLYDNNEHSNEYIKKKARRKRLGHNK